MAESTFELVSAEDPLESAEDPLVPDAANIAVDGWRRPRPHRLVAASAALVVVLGTACVLAAGRGVARFRANANAASIGLAEEEGKPTLNVMVMGHVGGGKSTLVGHLLAMEGVIPSDEVDKAKADAEDNDKASFSFAYLSDEEEEERKVGRTVHKNLLPRMETENYKVTFIDVPGYVHQITEVKEAAAMADAALLVVDASPGAFEAGIAGKEGGSRQHIFLAYSYGIKQLIVAVNKMDNTKYSQVRYDMVKKEVEAFAKKVGFHVKAVAFVPVSGYLGENLNSKSDKLDWFNGWSIVKSTGGTQGVTLKEAIDALEPVARDMEGALRMPINDGKAGQPLVAYVESGSVSVGAKVQLCPSGTQATVDKLQFGDESAESASAGAVVLATLSADAGAVVKSGGVVDAGLTWASGEVAYDESSDCTKVDHFDVQLIVMENPHPSPCRTVDFTNNFTTTIDVGFQHVPTTWKMLQKIDRRSGKLLEENPKHLGEGDAGVVRLYPQVDIDLGDPDKKTIYVVSADKVGLKTPIESTTATGFVKAVNTAGDEGPPQGKNSPENKEIPYNPCFKVPECVEYFFGECPNRCDSGYMVAHDDEGNKLDEDDIFDWGECNQLVTDGAYPGKGVPTGYDCCT